MHFGWSFWLTFETALKLDQPSELAWMSSYCVLGDIEAYVIKVHRITCPSIVDKSFLAVVKTVLFRDLRRRGTTGGLLGRLR